MNKNTPTTLTVLIVIIVAILAYLHFFPNTSQKSSLQTRTLISTVAYTCDTGTIMSAYYAGLEAPQSIPGEPPVPTGSVDVSFGGTPTTTLAQTISADGIRYANSDESLVFWSKGETALVMRDNSMDPEYANCTAAPASSTSSTIGLPTAGPITLVGTMVCLPHQDTSGPQTLECAIGLKDDSGRYFALSSSDPTKIGTLPSGSRVQVTGTFTARTDSKYQDVGVITVEDYSKM